MVMGIITQPLSRFLLPQPGPNYKLTTKGPDCDDNNAEINPATIWYKDVDNDGYSDGATITQCARPPGYRLASELNGTSGDCDDGNAAFNPMTVWYKDIDNDGYSDGFKVVQCTRPIGYRLPLELTAISGDCDDSKANINPASVWYKDADNDGYSDGNAITRCLRPGGYKLASELIATSGTVMTITRFSTQLLFGIRMPMVMAIVMDCI
jgi:hypothetical protein